MPSVYFAALFVCGGELKHVDSLFGWFESPSDFLNEFHVNRVRF